MRFKKLRFVVAIAIVLFILLVGNIVAFGLAKNNNSDSKNTQELKLLAPIYPNKSSGDISQNSNSVHDNQNVVVTNPSPPKVVVHRTIRTSAS
jgi:hypothetical protein